MFSFPEINKIFKLEARINRHLQNAPWKIFKIEGNNIYCLVLSKKYFMSNYTFGELTFYFCWTTDLTLGTYLIDMIVPYFPQVMDEINQKNLEDLKSLILALWKKLKIDYETGSLTYNDGVNTYQWDLKDKILVTKIYLLLKESEDNDPDYQREFEALRKELQKNTLLNMSDEDFKLANNYDPRVKEEVKELRQKLTSSEQIFIELD